MAAEPLAMVPRPSNVELLRAFRAHKQDPDRFYRGLSARAIAELGLPLRDRRILDLGCGRGWDAEALAAQGATVVALELDADLLTTTPTGVAQRVAGDGRITPFRAASFDGVYCSNVLEHTPRPADIFEEIARLTRPGGWIWISWTNWFSPVGGHELRALHYLGPKVGPWLHDRLFGPPEINAVGEQLWPTYVGRTLRDLHRDARFDVVDATPRYYPSQRWILRVPGVRELVTWNCAITLRRTGSREP